MNNSSTSRCEKKRKRSETPEHEETVKKRNHNPITSTKFKLSCGETVNNNLNRKEHASKSQNDRKSSNISGSCANDRLKRLRSYLEETQGVLVKAHTAPIDQSAGNNKTESDAHVKFKRNEGPLPEKTNAKLASSSLFQRTKSKVQSRLKRFKNTAKNSYLKHFTDTKNSCLFPSDKNVHTETVFTSTPKQDKLNNSLPAFPVDKSTPTKSSPSSFSFLSTFSSLGNKDNSVYLNSASLDKSKNLQMESMDWEEVNCSNLSVNITEDNNGEKSVESNSNVEAKPNDNAQNSKDNLAQSSVLQKLLIVIDTNVLLHHLDVLRQLYIFPRNELKIYIPYQVLRELDFIKDGRQKREHITHAINAVNFISEKLSSNTGKLQGESVEVALLSKFPSSGGDDSILSCCIRLKNSGADVILLTEDKNLRNKALVSKLKTSNHENIFALLTDLPTQEIKENPIVNEVRMEFSLLCSFIISKRLEVVLGKSWQEKVKSEPPWTIRHCLRLFIKYWNAITQVSSTDTFSSVLPKQCRKTLGDFLEFLEGRTKIEDKDFKAFKEHCLNMCLYIKEGFGEFEKNVDSTVEKIIKKSRNFVL